MNLDPLVPMLSIMYFKNVNSSTVRLFIILASQRLGDIANPNDFLVELISVGLSEHQVLDTRQKSIDGVAVKAKQVYF